MIKKMKYMLMIFMISLMLVSCTSTEYKGEFPQLYSVATHSILGNLGYADHTDSIITIIEEDGFGRILFSYTEETTTYSILILQKSDEVYSYYYEDYNFISKEFQIGNNYFSTDKIDELKKINDWNKEINESKCTKVKIETKKSVPDLKFTEAQFESTFKKIAKLNGYEVKYKIYRSSLYLTSDNYGRALYYAWGIGRDVDGGGLGPNSPHVRFDIVLIINQDGTYDEDYYVMQIEDLYTYQDILKEFKELNKWNQSLC